MGAKLCTMFFEQGKNGWSESFYRDGETLAQCETALKALATTRAKGLSNVSRLIGIRASDVDVFGDSAFDFLDKGQLPNAPDDAAHSRDVAGVGEKVRLEAGDSLYRRIYFIRGFPDDWIAFNVNGSEKGTAPLNAFMDLYKADLVTNGGVAPGWRLRVISKDPADSKPAQITALAFPDNETIPVTLVGQVPTPGTPIKIRSCKGTNVKQVNGRYIVQAAAGQVVTLKKRIYMDPLPVYLGKGVLTQQAIIYPTIASFDRGKFGHRNMGRPTYL